jgi:SOS-response transcriptional repressor LexA
MYYFRMSTSATKHALQMWVEAGLSKAGKSNTELAHLLGIPQSRVSEMRRGIRMPKISELPVIASYIEEPVPQEIAEGLSSVLHLENIERAAVQQASLAEKLKAQRHEAELLAARRVAEARARVARAQEPLVHYRATPEELAQLPHHFQVPLLSWVSAGKMSFPDVSDEVIGTVQEGNLDPEGDWIALQVVGDSMDRISPPESIIFVDRSDKVLVPNACYVISNGDGEATYKRFRSNPMRFEPVSTNPSHEPIYPAREPLIVGRVKKSTIQM